MSSGSSPPSPTPGSDATPLAGTVAVVTVNWNSGPDILQVHRSLKASTHQDWLLIVVDNASPDGSGEQLAQAGLERAEIVRHPTNSGFAGGCNVGIARALALGAEHVFLLNADAEVAPDCLARLRAASARLNQRAVLGPVVRYMSSGDVQFMGSERSRHYGHPVWKVPPVAAAVGDNGLIASDFVFGAALFCPAALFRPDSVGAFDERFFLNYEETDWCYRAAARGIGSWIVPDATVLHRSSATLGAVEAPMQRYFLTRNELLFSERHGSAGERARVVRRALGDVSRRLRRRLRTRTPLDGADHATLLAIRDYVTRRFGDCPPRVRQLARQAAAKAVAP